MYIINVIMLAMGIVVKTVSCLPDGAPPRSCISMRPDHYNVLGDYSVSQTGPSPYKLLATWDKRMELIRVAVSGNERIQGFLIQGRLTTFGPAVGRFINIADNIDATYQDCTFYTQFHRNSSVTHSNSGYQNSLEFYWEPPKNLTDSKQNVTFFATLAKNKITYWELQQSNSLPLNMDLAVSNTPPSKASVESLVLLLTTLVFLLLE